MARVICDPRNRPSHLINGVRFAPIGADGEMLSEQISDEVAAEFCAIRGYSLWEMRGEARGTYGVTGEKQASVSHKKAAPQKETA
jgi:hypothetical protein